MVLEILIIGGVIWYYTDKHRKQKKAKLAAAANAAQNLDMQQRRRNMDGGYSDLPQYRDAYHYSPPKYEHGEARVVPGQEAALPTYTESAAGDEKSPIVVDEKRRTT